MSESVFVTATKLFGDLTEQTDTNFFLSVFIQLKAFKYLAGKSLELLRISKHFFSYGFLYRIDLEKCLLYLRDSLIGASAVEAKLKCYNFLTQILSRNLTLNL